MKKSYAIPSSLCLGCGYMFDHTSNMTGKGAPKAGDLTLCLNCGALLEFTDELRTKPISDKALKDISATQHYKLTMTQRFIQRRGPLHPTPKAN